MELNDIPMPPAFDEDRWRFNPGLLPGMPNTPYDLNFSQVQQVLKFGLGGSLVFTRVRLFMKSLVLGSEAVNQPFACILRREYADSPEFVLWLWSNLAVLRRVDTNQHYYLTTFQTFTSHFEALIHNGL
jgi:hypothetical protein